MQSLFTWPSPQEAKSVNISVNLLEGQLTDLMLVTLPENLFLGLHENQLNSRAQIKHFLNNTYLKQTHKGDESQNTLEESKEDMQEEKAKSNPETNEESTTLEQVIESVIKQNEADQGAYDEKIEAEQSSESPAKHHKIQSPKSQKQLPAQVYSAPFPTTVITKSAEKRSMFERDFPSNE